MEGDKSKLHTGTEDSEVVKSGHSSTMSSFDICDDILLNSSGPKKATKSPHFKKPDMPPPEEESCDLYSEFMEEKSEWNSNFDNISLDHTDQLNLCTGNMAESSTRRDQTNDAISVTAVTKSESEADVNLDLFTEVLTDELQARHDSTVELLKKNSAATARIEELECELKTMKAEQEKLQSENVTIKKNMSSLLLTARSELKRKDDEICRLNSLLTKRKINNFLPKQDVAKKAKEMSPGHQRVVDIWAKARMSDTEMNHSSKTPSSRNDNESDSVKRKRTELADQGTPKRQKVSSSKGSGMSDCDKSGESTSRKSESLSCEDSKRKSRYSAERKSGDKGSKSNSSDRIRDRDRYSSSRHTNESSKNKKSEDKKLNCDSQKEKSARLKPESKESVVEKAPGGVVDLRDILRRKRDMKTTVSTKKPADLPDRKKHADDSKYSPSKCVKNHDTENRTIKIPGDIREAISKENHTDEDMSANEQFVPSEEQPCQTKSEKPDCGKSEDTGVKNDSSTPVSETKVLREVSDQNGEPKDNIKCSDSYKSTCEKSAQDSKETPESARPLDLNSSQMTLDVKEVFQGICKDSSRPFGLHDKSAPSVRKELRRIKPVMISGRKSASLQGQDKDGQSCFDAVIRNIEQRESVDFAQAKVVHVDTSPEGSSTLQFETFGEKQQLESVAKQGIADETPSVERNVKCQEYTETDELDSRTSKLQKSTETVPHKSEKCVDKIVIGLPDISTRKDPYVEENEHILLCTKYPDKDNSFTSLSSEAKAESVASDISEHDSSVSLIMEYEICSRTTPYKSSWNNSKCRPHTQKSETCTIDCKAKMFSKNKSKSKKDKHKTKSNCSEGSHADDGIETSLTKIASDETQKHRRSLGVDVEEIPEVWSPSDHAPLVIPLSVSSKDVNQNFECDDANGNNCEHSSRNPTDSLQRVDQVLDLEVQTSGLATTLRLEGTSNSPVVGNKQLCCNRVSCVDCRLNGHERPPYHVEPFEFTSFPVVYAKAESEDGDRLIIAELSESDKDIEKRDSSFEMDTSEAKDEQVMSCRGSLVTENYNEDKDISAKPMLFSNLHKHLAECTESSSGFCPNDISPEHSEKHVVCDDEFKVEQPLHLKSGCQVAGVEKSMARGQDKEISDIVCNDPVVDHCRVVPEVKDDCEKELPSDATEKLETKGKSEKRDQVAVNDLVNQFGCLPKQNSELLLNSQTSFSVEGRSSVVSNSARSRKCSEPQPKSTCMSESESNSLTDPLFTLSRVESCLSTAAQTACHPIDLSVKSIVKNERSLSTDNSHQVSKLEDLSGFSISKDGALDLSKKQKHSTHRHLTMCSTDVSDCGVRSDVRSPQICLKPCSSEIKISLVTSVESMKGMDKNVNKSQHCSHSVDFKRIDSPAVEKKRTESKTEEGPSSTEEGSVVDVTTKSANTSIQSLNLSITSDEGHSEAKNEQFSCDKELQDLNKSTDSEADEITPSESEACTNKSTSDTQVTPGTSSTSVVSTNQSSNTSVQSSEDKSSNVSNVTAVSGSGSSSASASSADEDSDCESSEDNMHDSSSEDEDVCVTDDDDVVNCENSQSEILAQSLSSESVQKRKFDIVKLDLEISDDSSVSFRESCENLAPSKSSSEVNINEEALFKLPDMSSSSFAKLTSASSESSTVVKTKSSECQRKRLSIPPEESSVLSILADSCDGFDCEQDDHKEDCRKFEDDAAAEPMEQAADSEDEDGCMEDGELYDDESSPQISVSKPTITEEESQELSELLNAKKLLEEKIHGICRKGSKELSSSKSEDRDNRHSSRSNSSSRSDRKSVRSRDSREKDAHRSAKFSSYEQGRCSREIHGSDPRLKDRSSSRYRREREESRHKHYSPSHRSHTDERRERYRDISPVSHRTAYKGLSKENHRREGDHERYDKYAVDGRHRNRPWDADELERGKTGRSSVSHHSSRRSSRDLRS